jgi:bifunctional non-homologous end joining protein LigD
MHWDFRLELDGVLLSWAVPKGPSLVAGERRLAVRTEDHPLDYAGFEGVIPQGEYGGGTVIVWDRGTWEPLSDPRQGLKRGKLDFVLSGEKLGGAFTLVRLAGSTEAKGNWLLIKRRDQAARDGSDIVKEAPQSVLSGASLQTVGARMERTWHSSRAGVQKPTRATSLFRPSELGNVPGARRAKLRGMPEPEKASLALEGNDAGGYVYEVKLDGYRLLAERDGPAIRLFTRRGHDWSARYPELDAALSQIAAKSFWIDGEAVVLNEQGISDFQMLQNSDAGVVYFAFDLLYLDGFDLRGASLLERKRLLARLVASLPEESRIRLSEHLEGRWQDILAEACRLGVEGVVAKRGAAPYGQGAWRKLKCKARQEFVVAGYTEPQGGRSGFGALLLGVNEDGALRSVGKVGTGFTEASLRALTQRLRSIESERPPFAKPPRERGVHWVRPELVAEIEFTGFTDDGRLRHPSFRGLRDDKDPRDVVRELPPGEVREKPAKASATLTNPARVLWPEQGITKAELAAYYTAAARWILPHLTRRPLMLKRCPEGIEKGCFFQKHESPGLTPSIRRVVIVERDGPDTSLYVDTLAGILACVQLGSLEIHTWGSRVPDIEHPDQMVFDLDPAPGLGFGEVVRAARELRRRFARLGLTTFVRTSGGKGLHVVAPLVPSATWDELKNFTHAIAMAIEREAPERFTSEMSKSKRGGKIFLDYLRNARGATVIASYSTRARPGAPVALPLRWDELSTLDSADAFTLERVRARLVRLKKDPWDGYFEVRQRLPKH